MNVINETREEELKDKMDSVREMCNNFIDCNGTCGTLARLILGVINDKSNN